MVALNPRGNQWINESFFQNMPRQRHGEEVLAMQLYYMSLLRRNSGYRYGLNVRSGNRVLPTRQAVNCI